MFKANDLDKLKSMGFKVQPKAKPKEDELCETAKKHLMQENVLNKIRNQQPKEQSNGTNKKTV